jgi:uncharacterized membrane protein YcjF (UPF0283 family)
MLRKLASTAPAIGNVQDRLERLHDLQPRIQSALDDAHELLKNRKDIYKPQEEGEEECEDDKPKRKSCKVKKTAVAVTIVVLLNVTVVLSQLLQWSLHHAVAIIHAATNVVIAQLQSLIQSLLL